jgi:NitT/TauT family transport system ATP-binding protein
MDVLVDAHEVSKVFRSAGGTRGAGDVTAIERIDLQVADGEFVSVLGPSGCGKSTFLFMVAGFEAPTGGRISVAGEPVTRPGPDRGVVFQEYALFPWLTVLDNVAYGLREQGMDRREREEIARRYVAQVGLEGFADRRPHELSGGMRQRVALARVLAIRPHILLMDEPFGALDEQTRFLLQEALLRIWERERKTVIFVTHSLEEAVFLSDRVVVMTARPGRVKEIVSVDLPRPRERTSEDFNTIRRRLAKAIQDEVLAAQRDWGSPA